jgi:hypothetical protein
MEINESEEEENEDFLIFYLSTFFDVHSDRLEERQTYYCASPGALNLMLTIKMTKMMMSSPT